MSIIVIKWGNRLAIESCYFAGIRMGVRWKPVTGTVCNGVGFVLDKPSELPEIIEISLKNLPFQRISQLKGLYYTATGSPPNFQYFEDLKVGNIFTMDRCAIKSFTFNYDKVYTTNILAKNSDTNLGIYGSAKLQFMRSLAYD